MKPAPFAYHAPATLDEALELLAEHSFDAKLLAGGQSLIPVMNFRLAQPGMLIDLNRIAALDGIELLADGTLRIGAMTRHSAVERSKLVAQHAPLLAATMPFIAHPQIRNRGTVGGSLAHADPAAELPVIALARDATLHLRSAGSARAVRAGEFFTGLFATALEPDEMLTAVDLPPFPAHTGFGFHEFARRHGDYAQAGVAVLLTVDAGGTCTAARIVFLNLGDTPRVAHDAAAMLVGQPATAEAFAAAAAHAARHEIAPGDDVHASADYKRHLAGVLTRRALADALERASHSHNGAA